MVDILFYMFAAVAIGGALGVVMSRSPVGSLLFMVVTLASLAGIFVLLEAHFLAAVQVIVYAGAIMVLFLFVIMLLNLGHDYQRDLKGGAFAVLSFAWWAPWRASWPGSSGRRRRRRGDVLGGRPLHRRRRCSEFGAVGAIAPAPLHRPTWCPSRSPGSCSWWPSSGPSSWRRGSVS